MFVFRKTNKYSLHFTRKCPVYHSERNRKSCHYFYNVECSESEESCSIHSEHKIKSELSGDKDKKLSNDVNKMIIYIGKTISN